MGTRIDDTRERDVSTKEAHEFAAYYGLKYYECSAKTGDGVDDLFHAIVKRIQ